MKGALIGTGSFGAVYLGLNPMNGQLLAVKQVELPKEGRNDERKQLMVPCTLPLVDDHANMSLLLP